MNPSRETLSEFLDRWLVTKKRPRERTLQDYRSHIKCHIRPSLGSLRVSLVTREHVGAFVTELSTKGLSPRSIQYVFTVLNMAFNYGVRTGDIIRNPCASIELPEKGKQIARALNAGDTLTFLNAIRGHRQEAFWTLLLVTGMRPGEALALKWADVDFEAETLSVRASLTRLAGGGWTLSTPKTDLSRRSLFLSPALASLFRSQRSEQRVHRISMGASYTNHDFVFAASYGQPLDYGGSVRREFKTLLKTAGLPAIRPYDLRHTSATLAMVLGTPVKVVSERLGHADTKMTMRVYQHVLPGMQRNAGLDLEALLFTTTDSLKRVGTQ